jgi:hypothetical protein
MYRQLRDQIIDVNRGFVASSFLAVVRSRGSRRAAGLRNQIVNLVTILL